MPRLPALALLVTILAVLAAGCGGDDGNGGGEAFPAETYARETCELALEWTKARNDILSFQRGDIPQATAANSVSNAQAKTTVYVGTIRSAEEPEGAEAQDAYASLQDTADSLSQNSQQIKAEGNKLATDQSTPEQAAEFVLGQIELVYDDLRASVDSLDAIAPEADIKAQVADDQACEGLGL